MARRRFTLSLQLPIKIRQIIWNLTLEPRFVEVRPKAHNQAGFFTLTPPPTALSVCQDSRDAVLQFYPNLLDKEYVIHPNKLTVYDQAVGAAIPGTQFNSCMDIKAHNGQFQPVPDEHNCFSVDFEWRILEDDAVDFFTNIIVSIWEPQELVFVSDAYGLDPYCFYQARNERAALTIFMDDYIYDVFRAPNNDPIYDYRDELYAMRSLAYRDPFRYDCLLRIHKYGLNICHCLKFGWKFPASESPNVATMDTYTSW